MKKDRKAWLALPRLALSNGTVEALKWLALILMSGDHVNKYLFNGTFPVLFEAGRLALPLFVFILAYNLARPSTMKTGAYQRTMMRLAICGVLASPAFIALGGLRFAGWWPLNVMFTLLAFTVTSYLVERGNVFAAGLVFLVGGGLSEYWWPAIAFGLAVWSYRKRPTWTAAVVALLVYATLWVINHDMWALAALPVILLATRFDLQMPRRSWIFYGYYPLHLGLLWLIRFPMRKAGYLFFM